MPGAFRLSPLAQADLDEIFDYTVRQWGLDQAERYTLMLESACASVAEDPAEGRDCSHIRAGYRRVACGRHYIYFRTTDYGIAVIRILHQRMDEQRHL